jgi:hypothetical protein
LFRYLQTNYAISYLFYLHLILYACVERFDVMDERGNILGCDGEVNKALAPLLFSSSGGAPAEESEPFWII